MLVAQIAEVTESLITESLVTDPLTSASLTEFPMSIACRDLAASHSLRVSLKRGLARQALDHAERSQASLPDLFRIAADLRPNRKALERMAQRMKTTRGVVRASVLVNGAGVVIVVRNVREVVTRSDATDIFTERAILYSRIAMHCGRDAVHFGISRASFCQHALERLVERSCIGLEAPLLAQIDAEAAAVLLAVMHGTLIEDEGDDFARALRPGLWAGAVDFSGAEADWGVGFARDTDRVPVFSARTFLGPAAMRPRLWQKWQALG